MNLFRRRPLLIIPMLLMLIALSACATIKVSTMPPPPPTAKLRIVIQGFSGRTSVKWLTDHEEWAARNIDTFAHILDETGIYTVVPQADLIKAVGNPNFDSWHVERNNYQLAREIGKALHAEYYLLFERTSEGMAQAFDRINIAKLISVETGAVYESRSITSAVSLNQSAYLAQLRAEIKESYRRLFDLAKGDMLAMAVRKGRTSGPLEVTKAIQNAEPKAALASQNNKERPTAVANPEPKVLPGQLSPASPVSKPVEPPTPKKEEPLVASKAVVPSSDLLGSGLIEKTKKDRGAKKIIVYDFDVSDQYRTVALILTEALREEVFKLNQFILVNREDLQKVLEEIALQQTGLIDEKQAVRTGKGLAANQVVTGRLGLLSKTFMMQAKCIDVETFATQGVSSIKFSEGQEVEALDKLPDFARRLVGL